VGVNQPTAAPRRRHLMDPNAPRQKKDPEAVKKLETTQRRVVSAVVMTIVLHLTAALIISAVFDVAGDKAFTKVALVVIGALFWNVGIGAVLALNKKAPLSLWHLTSLVPLAIGLWLAFTFG
jgi:membrane glycosyltransferase